jgi:cytochrome c-type biogenesis protein CcmF
MSPGDSLSIGKYTITLEQIKNSDNPNYRAATGLMTIYQQGQLVDTILPETRFYKTSEQPTTEVAMRSTLKEDLYVVFSGMNQNSKTVFRAYLFPLVAWIWIGGVVFVVGTLICLIPSKQGQPKVKAAARVETEELVKA